MGRRNGKGKIVRKGEGRKRRTGRLSEKGEKSKDGGNGIHPPCKFLVNILKPWGTLCIGS